MLFQFYSNYSISCLKSTPTIAYVTSCPKNKLEWDNAASRKKCDSIAADLKCAATTSDFQYHCLMNQWQNATIEVCANLFYLQGLSFQLSLNVFHFDQVLFQMSYIRMSFHDNLCNFELLEQFEYKSINCQFTSC